MSRSYRKTPIRGVAPNSSDKAFKAAEHKRARRAINARDLSAVEPPAEKEFGNPRASNKDGKGWVDLTIYPNAMRK